MVSSINDGEGSFKNVFICTGYAFIPVIIFLPIITVLSYAFTMNEGFIIYLCTGVAVVWSVINIYLVVQELHNFNFGNAILNIVMTLLAVLIALVGFLIVYLMFQQAISFIGDLYREVLFRVT
jgi:hypothetical protein